MREDNQIILGNIDLVELKERVSKVEQFISDNFNKTHDVIFSIKVVYNNEKRKFGLVRNIYSEPILSDDIIICNFSLCSDFEEYFIVMELTKGEYESDIDLNSFIKYIIINEGALTNNYREKNIISDLKFDSKKYKIKFPGFSELKIGDQLADDNLTFLFFLANKLIFSNPIRLYKNSIILDTEFKTLEIKNNDFYSLLINEPCEITCEEPENNY